MSSSVNLFFENEGQSGYFHDADNTVNHYQYHYFYKETVSQPGERYKCMNESERQTRTRSEQA